MNEVEDSECTMAKGYRTVRESTAKGRSAAILACVMPFWNSSFEGSDDIVGALTDKTASRAA
jgi:hypothetical protein